MNFDQAIQSALEKHKAGNLRQAELLYRTILEKRPDDVDALHLLGVLYNQLGAYDSAITYIRKALKIDPGFAEAYNNLGNVIRDKGSLNEAETYYQKALQIDPEFAVAYNNVGNVYADKKQADKAIGYLRKAVQINPDFAEAYCNLGQVLHETGHSDEAIVSCRKAIQIKPDYAKAYYNLGIILQEKGHPAEDAVACCKKALDINPDFAEAHSKLTSLMQETCDWQELTAMTEKLDTLTRKALDKGRKPAEQPFLSITRTADPSVNFAIAKSWSRDIDRTVSGRGIVSPCNSARMSKTKISVGYLSNDFRNHATSHLMLSMFGLHNRDIFRILCYSCGKNDGSSYRSRILHDCDKFFDISSRNYDTTAKQISEDQVDILVDLNGYTQGNRLEIFALRPAPVQVSYLGFPGTTGASFIDYIITDRIVTPENQSSYYSEKFVYMPHCYQVTDNTQPISDTDLTRSDFGLPEGCFVFCSFNQPYKIEPVMFDAWMRILRQVPASVLWLIFSNKTAKENLKLEAEAKGVSAERLIFAENLPKHKHLSRLRLADLALDTRIYNGHTTTSDALWAGIPVITLQGSHFASRVSSSILSALEMPELITYSSEEYEALAVRLAYNPVELRELRQRIAKNRIVASLFDTPRYVRNIERAYEEMWKIYIAGAAPRQIEFFES